MRKATFPAIAGKPPADAAQPSGMNGIIVTVIMNVTQEPRAPRIPNLLFQNPKNKSPPNNHSETPKKPTGPLNAENRVHPRHKRAAADKRDQSLRLVKTDLRPRQPAVLGKHTDLHGSPSADPGILTLNLALSLGCFELHDKVIR